MFVLALERRLMIYDAVSEDPMGMEQLMMLAINCHPFRLIIKQLYVCTTHGTRCRLGSIQNLDSEGRTMNDQHLKATPGRTGENWSVEGGVEEKWLLWKFSNYLLHGTCWGFQYAVTLVGSQFRELWPLLMDIYSLLTLAGYKCFRGPGSFQRAVRRAGSGRKQRRLKRTFWWVNS